jgi:hypothetical protein
LVQVLVWFQNFGSDFVFWRSPALQYQDQMRSQDLFPTLDSLSMSGSIRRSVRMNSPPWYRIAGDDDGSNF